MSLLLKKEKQQISLWLKISFCKENQKYDNWILIYKITLGRLLSFDGSLEKVNQSGWFETPTKLSSSLHKELGIG